MRTTNEKQENRFSSYVERKISRKESLSVIKLLDSGTKVMVAYEFGMFKYRINNTEMLLRYDNIIHLSPDVNDVLDELPPASIKNLSEMLAHSLASYVDNVAPKIKKRQILKFDEATNVFSIDIDGNREDSKPTNLTMKFDKIWSTQSGGSFKITHDGRDVCVVRL